MREHYGTSLIFVPTGRVLDFEMAESKEEAERLCRVQNDARDMSLFPSLEYRFKVTKIVVVEEND